MKWFIIILIILIIIGGLFVINKNILNKNDETKINNNGGENENKMEIKSIFKNGEKIPEKYTADGEDVNPSLEISSIPNNARSLVLIIDDPDAPVGTWVHWVVWNIPANINKIEENSIPENSVQGKNSWNNNEYGGPSPPSGTHRYFFKLYALDNTLSLDQSADKKAVENAMKGHILAKTELMGVYSR